MLNNDDLQKIGHLIDLKLDKSLVASEGRTNKKLVALEERVGKRIDEVEERVGKRIDEVEERVGKKLNESEERMGKRLEEMERSIIRETGKFLAEQILPQFDDKADKQVTDRLENRLDHLGNRVSDCENQIKKLKDKSTASPVI